MSDIWACDVRISQPETNKKENPPLVDMGGFAFTATGISHNISDADIEDLFTPDFAPIENIQL